MAILIYGLGSFGAGLLIGKVWGMKAMFDYIDGLEEDME